MDTMNKGVKLDRALSLSSVVLFGLAYMTPMIVFGTFGALATTSQGLSAKARSRRRSASSRRRASTNAPLLRVTVRASFGASR